MNTNPLGLITSYPNKYSPELLFAIPRQSNRKILGLNSEKLPFSGYDVWRAYELSWLNSRGKPVAAVGILTIPCESRNIVESKSLKLYLNSMNQTRFPDMATVEKLISHDLSQLVDADVIVHLVPVVSLKELDVAEPAGICIDHADVDVAIYEPAPHLLKSERNRIVSETLYSNLFRSNCPVTGQPDWGTVVIDYCGGAIDHAALLGYLVSYRSHEGFHEDCTEQIYLDLIERCAVQSLRLSINFLRRGGIEINPVRFFAASQTSFYMPRFTRQ